MEDGYKVAGIRVLLVDDDADCLEYLTLALEGQDVNVTQALSAEEALEKLKDAPFDAVTTDKNLPNMDGITLIREIRRLYGDLPVILVTGHGTIGSAVDALKYGAQDYLLKPLEDGDQLVSAIWRAVERHRLSKENRLLQEKLVRAQRMESLGILAGGVAHDLNNILGPITALPAVIVEQLESISEHIRQLGDGVQGRIVGATGKCLEEIKSELKMMEMAGQGFDDVKEELVLMETSGRKAAAVVKDLLTLSESGNYEKKAQDVNRIAQACVNALEFQDLCKNRPDLRVELRLEPHLPRVMGSESHLSRVISNLGRNAVQAMDSLGKKGEEGMPRLTIMTEKRLVRDPIVGYEVIQPGTYVVVTVDDTGKGIPGEHLERIFEPFYTTKERSNTTGSGLGLSIVHRVIKDHGGYIDLSSVLGQGTTFRLFLPVAPNVAERVSEMIAVKGGGERILVVDDEPAARYVAERLLRSLGYKVTSVCNGHEAVDVFDKAKAAGQKSPFDLIMLDMIMEEGFDGLATYEKISAMYPRQKVVVASGFAPTGRAKMMMDLGAGWLAKPYGMKDLASALRHELTKK